MKDSELIFGLMSAFEKGNYSFDDLKYLSAPFQVSESSLRTNLSRMVSKNLINSVRYGKISSYKFTEKGERIKQNIAKGFKTLNWNNWDNFYWGVFFSFPESKKEERHKVRKKLIAYRFINLYPGFWIRPRNVNEKLESLFDKIFNSNFCKVIIFKEYNEMQKKEIVKLWKLDEINDDFKRELVLIEKKKKDLFNISPENALKERMLTGGEIINILNLDPLLPGIFLPEDWKANQLKKEFEAWDHKTSILSKPYWSKIM